MVATGLDGSSADLGQLKRQYADALQCATGLCVENGSLDRCPGRDVRFARYMLGGVAHDHAIERVSIPGLGGMQWCGKADFQQRLPPPSRLERARRGR